MTQKRIHGVWTNRWTFILAATGSAVGLGNIWKFPYITGENGGGAFVLVYLLCILLIGLPVMMAEVLIGRRGRQSPINSMKFVTQEAGLHGIWTGVGWMGVVAGLMIMAFYSVVAGWVLKYIFATAAGDFAQADGILADGAFGALLARQGEQLLWQSIFVVMTAAVVAAGVTRGLGMVARVMMPFLFVLLILLLIYGMVKGDFARGFLFLFDFKFDALTWDAVLVAMGHSFFTLSLGMGAIMAYGAYMPDHASIGRTIVTVGALDTLVALAAGLALFPIVFAIPALEPTAGPGLMFVSLPVAFGNMPFGALFGALFFILVALAAWSSAVSLIEPGVAWMVESCKLTRVAATALLSFIAWLGGIACIYVGRVFDILDALTSQIILPLGGLFIALFVGWGMRKAVVRSEMDGEGHPLFDIWLVVLKYVSPLLVALVMIATLVQKWL